MSLPTVSVEVMFNNTAPTGAGARTNNFDGGTNGVTITTANSGLPSGSVFSSVTGSPRFSNAQAYGSGLSAFNPSSGVDCHMDWTGAIQAGDVVCARYYLYLISAPAGSQRTFVLLGSAGVTSAVWMFPNRTLRLYLGFSTSVAAQLTTPVPTGQWVRVETRHTIDSAGNGTGEIWLYLNADSSIHDEYAISSTLAWPNGKPQGAEFHLQRDAGGYWHFDNIALGAVKLGPVVGTWTDVTLSGKRGINTRRGSTRIDSPIIRYEAGTASVTLNNTDRRFDPTDASGPYANGIKSLVTPMKPIRIRAVWNSVTYDVWRGFVDKWDVDHVADIYSEVTVTATDGFKVLRNKRRAAVAAVGAGENTGARITRILNSAGWSAGDRVIATGNSTLAATTLEGDALTELQDAGVSEIGELYMDAQGRVVFRNRHAALLETRSNTVQATFGTAAVFTPAQAKLNTDDATLWNEIRATRTGGVEQMLGDTASQDEYLTRTFTASNLMLETDTIVAGYAGWILYVSKDPEVRFDTIEIHAHADPATLFPIVLAREIGDRIRIIRQPSGGGSPITRDVFIRGISHTTDGARWVTTWNLQSATRYGSFLVLNNSILGKLNQNALAY